MHALLLMYFTQICCAVKGLCIPSVKDRCTTLQPYRENFIKPKVYCSLEIRLTYSLAQCETGFTTNLFIFRLF